MYSYNKCEKNNNAKAYRAATFCLFSHCSQIRKNASLTCSDDAYDIKMMSLITHQAVSSEGTDHYLFLC